MRILQIDYRVSTVGSGLDHIAGITAIDFPVITWRLSPHSRKVGTAKPTVIRCFRRWIDGDLFSHEVLLRAWRVPHAGTECSDVGLSLPIGRAAVSGGLALR
jgi:hypothetical protein